MLYDEFCPVVRGSVVSHTVNPYTGDPHFIAFDICNQLDSPLFNVAVSINGGRKKLIGDFNANEYKQNIRVLYRRYKKSNGYDIYWTLPDGTFGHDTGKFIRLHK